MTHQVLLISQHPEDARFWSGLAATLRIGFRSETDPEKIRNFLVTYPEARVFWDATPSPTNPGIDAILRKYSSQSRIFAITDAPINQVPGIQLPVPFGHHIFRRYEPPAPALYERFLSASLSGDPSNIGQYFSGEFTEKEYVLTHSSQRQEALSWIGDFLAEYGVIPRIASLAVDASDELIMNAIFDAPFDPDRGPFRRQIPRTASFPLDPGEDVKIRILASPEYIGIGVKDRFGSLKRAKVLKHLFQNYRDHEYVASGEEIGAGLGLHRINESAMALLFVSKPQTSTDSMVFFSNKKSFREFRLGFCFFSIFSSE